MNCDMSEIIEFVLPSKSEYEYAEDGGGSGSPDDDNNDNIVDDGGGGGSSEDGAEAAGSTGRAFVVLDDQIHPIHEYQNEEFIIINESNAEVEMLVDDAELAAAAAGEVSQDGVVGDHELYQYIQRVPKQEEEFVITEHDLDEIDDLVEEDDYEGELEEEEEDVEADGDGDGDGELLDTKYILTAGHSTASAIHNIPTLAIPKPKTIIVKQPYASSAGGGVLRPHPQSLIRANRTPAAAIHHIVRKQQQQDAYDNQLLQELEEEGPVAAVQPSDKMLDEFKGPRRYLLFDDLIATIVDFDEEGTPIVEFSMITSAMDEKLPVECGICPDVMHKTKLSKHQKTHLVPGTNRYACIYCSETYRDCKYLAGHARRHMGIRPYVCEVCKLYFSTKQDLRVHNQRRHLEKEHICEKCGKTFAQNTQLKRHREATHEKKRRFPCPHCQKAYYKNFSLQEHIRNVHMGKRRMLRCPFCDMQCRDAHKMARHRKEMHLNQDSFVCHLCQEEFTDINYFDAHKRSIQCRSNTKRQHNERRMAHAEALASTGDGAGLAGAAADLLEDEFDEDTGLLGEQEDDTSAAVAQIKLESSHHQHQQHHHHQQDGYVEVSHYDERLLVENDEEDTVEDEDHFVHYQQQQQQQAHQVVEEQEQQISQEFNDGEMIFEVTLETDN